MDGSSVISLLMKKSYLHVRMYCIWGSMALILKICQLCIIINFYCYYLFLSTSLCFLANNTCAMWLKVHKDTVTGSIFSIKHIYLAIFSNNTLMCQYCYCFSNLTWVCLHLVRGTDEEAVRYCCFDSVMRLGKVNELVSNSLLSLLRLRGVYLEGPYNKTIIIIIIIIHVQWSSLIQLLHVC